MAKKKARRSTAPARPSGSSPAQLSRRIERLDRELVKSLNERAKLVKKLAKAKSEDGAPAYDAACEQAGLEQTVESSRGPLEAHSIRSIFRERVDPS